MAKKKEPSIRAKKYIQNKVAGMTDYQAAIKAGYSPNTALAAKQNIENPVVKEEIGRLMEKKGLTDDKILDHLIEGLNAVRIHGTDSNFIEVNDYAVRAKYLDIAIKLKKLISTEPTTNIQVNNFIPLLGGDSSKHVSTDDSHGEAAEAPEAA